ncbi:NAD-dependent epimerase/dehydratase family protein [Christiangramia crocea]|uniref:NAD-dependent epimerase/dehydratase family protein n=1 Tax=Christiangramia crocea TaxID=2904124 RepID=A0A9X2A5T3_9FLAO|nr:NAD-dependent epimerase/dehydratase family protein [Gramella crocea]MCG9971699.1 NAD-dependent epimerase/dehydratase family protein [Gramella crocea]
MKIFITGITGYIGSKLALSLIEEGHMIHALVRDPNSATLPRHENIIPFKGKLEDIESIRVAMKGCKKVMHVAGYTNIRCKDIAPFYKVNVLGTSNVLKVAKEHEIKKFIYTSSVSVFGASFPGLAITESQPRMSTYTNDYELTKALGENLVREYTKKGVPGIILNVSRVYGPGIDCYSSGINKLFRIIMKNKFLIVPNKLAATANYVYIDDVVEAHKLAMEHATAGAQFIIGGENASYERLFGIMFTKAGIKKNIYTVNYRFLKHLCNFTSLFSLFRKYDNSLCSRILDFLFTDRAASSKKAEKELGYRYTSLEKGLGNTYEFIKNKGHENKLFHTYNRS